MPVHQYKYRNSGAPKILPKQVVTEYVPEDAIGKSIADPRWATVVGPGIPGSNAGPRLEMTRPRLTTSLLLDDSDYTNFRRNKRSAAAIRSIVKGVLLNRGSATCSKTDPLYLETIYQIAAQTDPKTAAWIKSNTGKILDMFGVAPMTTTLSSISRVINHDPDNEVEHFPEFVKRQKWLAKTGIGSAQAINAAVKARKLNRWRVTAKTAVTLAQRANDMKAAEGVAWKNIPQIGVFQLHKNGKPSKQFN